MDISQERRELFFSNLLLLGFDVEYMERKYRIPFNRDMFHVANKRAFEVVTQFLFSRLSLITSDDYPIIWPLHDKKQEQEFRKTCFTHLLKMSKDETVNVRFPSILQTTLLSPGGERFYELYLAFSTYILLKFVAKDGVCHPLRRPALTQQNQNQVKEILQLSTIIPTKEFMKVQRDKLHCEQKWQETAEHFVSYYRKTKRKILERQKCINEEVSSLFSLRVNNNRDGVFEQAELSDTEKLETLCEKNNTDLCELLRICHGIEDNLSKEKLLWDIVRTELTSECPEKHVLDGRKYNFSLPDAFGTDCKNDLQKRKIQSLEQNGKLSLKSFLGACCACMEYYKQDLQTAGFPDFKRLQQKLKDTIEELEQCLNSSKSLSQKMVVELLPDVAKDLEKLESFAYKKSEDHEEPFDLLLQATPTLTFTPGHSPNNSVSAENAYIFTPPTSETIRHVLRPSLRAKLQCQTGRSLAFDCHSSPRESGGNMGHLKPSANFNSSVASTENFPRKQLTRFATGATGSGDGVDFCDSFCNSNVYEPSHLSSNLSICNMLPESRRDHSVKSSNDDLDNCHISSIGGVKVRHVVPNFDTNSSHVKMRCSNSTLEKVKSNFVQQVVKHATEVNHNGAVPGDTDLLIHHENSNRSPDFIGQKAFRTHDKVLRSPSASSFTIGSTHQIARLSYELHSTGNEYFLNSSTEDHAFDDEQLDDITLPSVPIY